MRHSLARARSPLNLPTAPESRPFGLLRRGASLVSAFALGFSAAVAGDRLSEVIRVFPDGTVEAPVRFLGEEDGPVACRLSFGLPAAAPTAQTLEEDQLPVATTVWEHGGIRYTQTVFVTALGGNPAEPALVNASNAVLVVSLLGENRASEYTNAAAAIAMRAGAEPLALELRDGVLHMGTAPAGLRLGWVEVPATGIACPTGQVLRFQGSMPPGTSGSLTLKLPLAALREAKPWSDLQDLDFAEALPRVKRAWRRRLQEPPPPPAPVVLVAPRPRP